MRHKNFKPLYHYLYLVTLLLVVLPTVTKYKQ